MPKTNRPGTKSVRASLMLGALSFALSDDARKKLPQRVLLAKWGKNLAIGDGEEFIVGDQTARQLAANQQRAGWDVVAGDYEHQSVAGHPNFKADPREYWSHGHVEVVAGQGLFYVVDSYTPSGLKNAANYPDVSGQFFIDPKTRQVIAVRSVALCQHGQVIEARFQQAMTEQIAASVDSIGRINAVPQYRADGDAERVLSFARQLLDLGDDATPDDISAGLEEMVRAKNDDGGDADLEDDSSPDSATQPENKMADKDTPANTDLKELKETVTSLTATVNTLAGSVTQLAASQSRDAHNRNIEGLLQIAASQGKKVPDSFKAKDDSGRFKADETQLKELVAALPATESVEFLTPEQVVAAQSGGRMNFADPKADEAVMLALGITKEKWDKPLVGLRSGASFEDVKKSVVDVSKN